MSRVKKLTFTAMITALCIAVPYAALLLPGMRLAFAALAGIFPAAVVIVCGPGWAGGCWAAASLLGLLLLPDKAAALWFVCFFGHYPIWKGLIERLQTKLGKPWLGWLLKLAGAALCVLILWLILRDSFLGAAPYLRRGGVTPVLFCLGLAAAFVAYDVAFSILIGYFRVKILPRIR